LKKHQQQKPTSLSERGTNFSKFGIYVQNATNLISVQGAWIQIPHQCFFRYRFPEKIKTSQK